MEIKSKHGLIYNINALLSRKSFAPRNIEWDHQTQPSKYQPEGNNKLYSLLYCNSSELIKSS